MTPYHPILKTLDSKICSPAPINQTFYHKGGGLFIRVKKEGEELLISWIDNMWHFQLYEFILTTGRRPDMTTHTTYTAGL